MSNIYFYQDLPLTTDFDQVLNPANFTRLPDDWLIAIADIIDSTTSIQQGQYKTINTVAVFTIAALVNAVKPLQLPYVFGGDGTLFCLPPEYKHQVSQALQASQKLAETGFDLKMRISLIPNQALDQPVYVCHYKKNNSYQQAVFLGGGLQQAERLSKTSDRYNVKINNENIEGDFSGFECRWERVASPKDFTISLLVKPNAQDLESQIELYQELRDQIKQSIGHEDQHHPLNESGLVLGFARQTLKNELLVKSSTKSTWLQFLTLWRLRSENLLGWLLMAAKIKVGQADWGKYKSDFLHNSDFRKIDDMYRTVFSTTDSQWQQLKSWLEEMQTEGKLNYGIHQSDAALVTCLINQVGVNHLHFVDGADGGYALAATDLKSKLTNKSNPNI